MIDSEEKKLFDKQMKKWRKAFLAKYKGVKDDTTTRTLHPLKQILKSMNIEGVMFKHVRLCYPMTYGDVEKFSHSEELITLELTDSIRHYTWCCTWMKVGSPEWNRHCETTWADFI